MGGSAAPACPGPSGWTVDDLTVLASAQVKQIRAPAIFADLPDETLRSWTGLEEVKLQPSGQPGDILAPRFVAALAKLPNLRRVKSVSLPVPPPTVFDPLLARPRLERIELSLFAGRFDDGLGLLKERLGAKGAIRVPGGNMHLSAQSLAEVVAGYPPACWESITVLTVRGPVTSEGAEALARLPNLWDLSIDCEGPAPPALDRLRALPGLKRLSLYMPGVPPGTLSGVDWPETLVSLHVVGDLPDEEVVALLRTGPPHLFLLTPTFLPERVAGFLDRAGAPRPFKIGPHRAPPDVINFLSGDPELLDGAIDLGAGRQATFAWRGGDRGGWTAIDPGQTDATLRSLRLSGLWDGAAERAAVATLDRMTGLESLRLYGNSPALMDAVGRRDGLRHLDWSPPFPAGAGRRLDDGAFYAMLPALARLERLAINAHPGSAIGRADLGRLAGLPALRDLSLQQAVRRADLPALAAMGRVERLCLWRVVDESPGGPTGYAADWAALTTSPALQLLVAPTLPIDAAGIDRLERRPGLRILWLSGRGLTLAEARRLVALPGLEVLALSGDHLLEADRAALAKAAPAGVTLYHVPAAPRGSMWDWDGTEPAVRRMLDSESQRFTAVTWPGVRGRLTAFPIPRRPAPSSAPAP